MPDNDTKSNDDDLAARMGDRIDAGLDTIFLLTDGGEVFCWGDNSYGQLGIGTYDQSGKPLPIEAMILQ